MASLSCISSICKTHIMACSLPNNNTSPSLPHSTQPKPPLPRTKTPPPPPPLLTVQKQHTNQPSIAEIERAIGAGSFRDSDTSSRESEQSMPLFDSIFTNSSGKTEGSMEKKLRETGEWIIDQSESTSRSDAKKILMIVFLGILPMWILSFLVASGIVKLPFNTPYLDDLIM